MGKKILHNLILIAAALTLCFSAVMLLRELTKQQRYVDEFASLEGLISEIEAAPESGDAASSAPPRALSYAELRAVNPDFTGWVRIEGTGLSYPVMHTPGDPEKYLHRSFYGAASDFGVPFLDAGCTLQGDNLLIYGHNIKGSSRMFGALMRYKDPAFWKAHPVIQFDTLEGAGQYQIIAVFLTRDPSVDPAAYPYYAFKQAGSAADYDAYVAAVRGMSLYDTGVSAAYGEQLLTLSTCEYTSQEGRLVVVAKRV